MIKYFFKKQHKSKKIEQKYEKKYYFFSPFETQQPEQSPYAIHSLSALAPHAAINYNKPPQTLHQHVERNTRI